MNTQKIALIDDDQADLERMEAVLAAMPGKVEVTRAQSAAAAVGLLRDGRFDVAFIDQSLQGATGLELARRIGGRKCETPLILVASVGDDSLDLPALDAGFFDIVRKDEFTPVCAARVLRYARHAHRQERLLREALAREREANRANLEFIAQLSHDLRTPMNGIIGFSELMAARGATTALADRFGEYADYVKQSATQCLAMIEELLKLNRLEHGAVSAPPPPTDVADAVAGAVDRLQPIAKTAEVDLESHCECGPVYCRIQTHSVARIVNNLVENAIKYSPPGGAVSVLVDRIGDEAKIVVMDQGPGVPNEMLEKVLRPLARGPRPPRRELAGGGGFGIGLAAVRAIARAHGGDIELCSAPGDGLTATVSLPAALANTTHLIRRIS